MDSQNSYEQVEQLYASAEQLAHRAQWLGGLGLAFAAQSGIEVTAAIMADAPLAARVALGAAAFVTGIGAARSGKAALDRMADAAQTQAEANQIAQSLPREDLQ